jgi:hypothetical protein
MSVMEANTIDIVVPVYKDGSALLIIIDQLPRQIVEDDHLVMLQDEINAASSAFRRAIASSPVRGRDDRDIA